MVNRTEEKSNKFSLAHFLKIPLIIIGLVLLSLFLLNKAVNFLGPTLYNYYETYDDMIKDGGIKRGWFPTDFPQSASEIYVQYDLDINEMWVLFNAKRVDIDSFTEHMEPYSLENYKGGKLFLPKDGYLLLNSYKSIDTDLLINVFKGKKKNKYVTVESEAYIAELKSSKNFSTYYYWQKY